MVVVSMMGILAATAIPSLDFIIKKNRVANAVNSVASTLAIGRGEAIRRNRTVTICRMEAGATELECASGAEADWAGGWVAFIDADHDSELGEDDSVVNVVRADLLNASISLLNPTDRILLRADGTVDAADAASTPRWEVSAKGVPLGSMFETLKRTVKISLIGTVSIE